jgi:hypothetical protein
MNAKVGSRDFNWEFSDRLLENKQPFDLAGLSLRPLAPEWVGLSPSAITHFIRNADFSESELMRE